MLKMNFVIRDCFIGRNLEHGKCTVKRKAGVYLFLIDALGD